MKAIPQRATGGISGHQLQFIQRYIAARLDEQLSLAELSAQLQMSRFHFCRMFRRATGCTPRQWILYRRVELAKRRIRESDLRFTDLAFELGFSSQSHFNTAFLRLAGVTPGQWREHTYTGTAAD